MSDNTTRAREIFSQGFNCAQSVLAAFSSSYGLEERDALRVSGVFGGGMGRMGSVCGAVTGALMAIGLQASKTADGEDDRRDAGYRLVHEFSKRFTEIHGTLICKELIELDLSTDEGYEAAKTSGVFVTKCPGYVEDAVRILEEILPAPDKTI